MNRANHDLEACRAILVKIFADKGGDVNVSTAPPLRPTGDEAAYTCPHGTLFWLQPTNEQLAAWARDGAK